MKGLSADRLAVSQLLHTMTDEEVVRWKGRMERETGGTWQSELLYTAATRRGPGRLRQSVANVVTILGNDPSWAGVLAYDELRERPVIRSAPPWNAHDAPHTLTLGDVAGEDLTRVVAWLAREFDLDIPTQVVADAIATVARRSPFNPMREFLDGLVWDGVPRLDTWLATYAGAELSDYTRAVGAKFAIGAVARTYQPGCKVDTTLILEGSQGTGKSTICRTWAPRDELFFDSDLEIGNKDAVQAVAGKVIVEIGELHALSKAEATAVKAFVSRQTDTYRPSYGRVAMDFPRRWVAIGTTNSETYLVDTTGNRRWWPVRTGKIDAEGFRGAVAQLWAEAVVRFRAGERWHVDSDDIRAACEAEQDARTQQDPWKEQIAAWLAAPERRAAIASKGFVTMADLLANGLEIDRARWTKTDSNRVAEILRGLGWQRARRRIDGVPTWVHVPPIHNVRGRGTDGDRDVDRPTGTNQASLSTDLHDPQHSLGT